MRRSCPRLPLLAVLAATLAPVPGRAAGLELASVGTADAAFAWRSDEPEASIVRVRPAAPAADEPDAGADEWRTVEAPGDPSRFHVVEVEGLRSGTAYEYRLGPSGRSGTLTTLEPPPGEVRAVLWILADIHLCLGDCPDGVRRLGAAGAAYAAALGDISRRAAALPADRRRAAVILGDFSQWPGPDVWAAVAAPPREDLPLCVVPGNHDGTDARFAERLAELQERLASPACRYEGSRGVVDLDAWRLVLLDSVVPGEHHGRLGDEQLAWLELRLAEAPDRPTLLATHHPWLPHPASAFLGENASFTFLHDGDALTEAFGRQPQVVAVLSGHLHVNWTGEKNGVRQLLFSALAQYPMGYHSLTLYDGGLVRRFHPLAETWEEAATSAEAIRDWARRIGAPLPAAVPGIVFGGTGDRSAVISRAEPSRADAAPPTDVEPAATTADDGDAAATTADDGDGPATTATDAAATTAAPVPSSGGGRGSGCRCGVAGKAGPSGGDLAWWGTWIAAGWMATRRHGKRGRSAGRAGGEG